MQSINVQATLDQAVKLLCCTANFFRSTLLITHTLMSQMSSNSSSSPCRLPAVPACLLDLDFLLRQTTTTMMIPAWLHLFV
jgi:hypothetical protein